MHTDVRGGTPNKLNRTAGWNVTPQEVDSFQEFEYREKGSGRGRERHRERERWRETKREREKEKERERERSAILLTSKVKSHL